MKRSILFLTLVFFVVGLFACSEGSKPKTKDPLEALTYQYLQTVKVKDWDKAYAMFSEETRKYYPQKTYIEDATTHVLPKVDSVYVTRIEKHKLDAVVETKFKPKSSWATYNTMESALIKLNFVYQNGNWYIHEPEIVSKGMEEEAKQAERKARVDKWGKMIKLNNFSVENKITDEGPMLVFHGEVENVGDEAVEMVMVMVDFFDGKGNKVYNVIVVPVYVSPRQEMSALAPKSKKDFQQTLSSEIPDTWSGKVDYYVHDAGPMPNNR